MLNKLPQRVRKASDHRDKNKHINRSSSPIWQQQECWSHCRLGFDHWRWCHPRCRSPVGPWWASGGGEGGGFPPPHLHTVLPLCKPLSASIWTNWGKHTLDWKSPLMGNLNSLVLQPIATYTKWSVDLLFYLSNSTRWWNPITWLHWIAKPVINLGCTAWHWIVTDEFQVVHQH